VALTIAARASIALAAVVAGSATYLAGASLAHAQATPSCAGKPATIFPTKGPFITVSDNLRGTEGPDVMVGLGGNDLINGLGGDDTLCGDAGTDSLHGGGGRDELYGGDADRFTPDTLDDGDLPGAVDADVFVGNGDAILDYRSRTAAVHVDLVDPGPDGEPGEGDIVRGIYAIYTGSGDDVIAGTDGPNRLWPWTGADTVNGRGGADWIYLAGGDDRVIAGAGNDDIESPDSDGSTIVCGSGRDTVRSSSFRQGPWLSSTCERVSGRGRQGGEDAIDISFAPQPIATTPSGELTFRKPCPVGKQCRLNLTRPNPPFRRLATRVIRNRPHASLKLPSRFADRARSHPVRVRVRVTGRTPEAPWAVAWRFDLKLPPRR
jgi:hypothetical protein